MEIKEEFIAPTLAFFSPHIQSFGLSQIKLCLAVQSQKDTALLLDLAGGQFFITKQERYFLFQLVSTQVNFLTDFDCGKVKEAEEDTNKTAKDYN